MRTVPVLAVVLVIATASVVSAQVVKKSGKASMSQKSKQDRIDFLKKEIDRRWHHPENEEVGDYPAIVEILREIVKLDPQDVDSWGNLWYLLWSMGFKEDALVELKKGLEFNKDTYYMYDELGQYYRVALKDYKSAAQWFEQAIKFKDCKQTTFDALGRCHEAIGNLDRARRVWEAAVKRWPGDEYAKSRLRKLKEAKTGA